MTTPFFRLMGQIFVAVEAWDSLPDVRETMSKVGGLTKDQVEKGRELVKAGESLVERSVSEGGEDRIGGHNLHVAVGEVEIWLQTVKAALRSRVEDQAVIERALEHGLHAHDHTVTVMASALRTLGVLRTDAIIGQAYADRSRSLHDLVVRGQTFLSRAGDCGDVLLAPRTKVKADPIGAELLALRVRMEKWLEDLDRAAGKASDSPEILGLLGYLPVGVGRPGGGTSFAVPLHQRAQRAAPDPAQEGSSSGWSIGRQGRNRENLGKGFLTPNFE